MITTSVDRDTELIEKIKKGDRQAMRELVEKYKLKAYYLALGMVGNTDEAFDISQEAFIRVFRSAKKFIPGRQFFPWFYSIVANLCKDCLKRREKAAGLTVDIDEYAFLLVDESNPEKSIIRSETIRAVRRALMELDFQDREIIMLKHFRNHSYDEIAALLNVPRGTVMSRLYYARKKLAALLEDYERR